MVNQNRVQTAPKSIKAGVKVNEINRYASLSTQIIDKIEKKNIKKIIKDKGSIFFSCVPQKHNNLKDRMTRY